MKSNSFIKFCLWVIASILIYQILLSTVALLFSSQITSVKVYTNRNTKGGINLYSFDRKEIKEDITVLSQLHDSTDNFYNFELPKKFKNDRINLHFLNDKQRTAEIFDIHLVSPYYDFKIQKKNLPDYLLESSPCLIVDGEYVFQKKEGNVIALHFLPFSDIIKENIRYKTLGILILGLSILIVFLFKHFKVFSKITKKNESSALSVNGIFILILFTPMVIFFMHWDNEETSENRKLNAIEDIRSYMDIMFPFKSSLVYMNHFINEKFFLGPNNSNKVAVGKEGFLYVYEEETSLASYDLKRKYLSEAELDIIENRIVSHYDYCKKNGIEYLRVIYPNKFDIYTENLPFALQSAIKDTISRGEQISNRLLSKGIDVLSFKNTFEPYKYKTTYRKTDTHWNNFGGFLAYQDVMNTLYKRTNIKSYEPTKLEDYTFLYELIESGDIITKLADYPYNISDMGPVLFPKFPYEYIKETNDKRLPYDSMVLKNSKAKSDKTLLIFSDSYVMGQRLFYAMNFRTVYHLKNQAFNRDLIELLKPDVIIEGYAETTNNNLIY
jgi:hypothetical protein